MKRLIIASIATAALVSLSACTSVKETKDASTPSSTTTEQSTVPASTTTTVTHNN